MMWIRATIGMHGSMVRGLGKERVVVKCGFMKRDFNVP